MHIQFSILKWFLLGTLAHFAEPEVSWKQKEKLTSTILYTFFGNALDLSAYSSYICLTQKFSCNIMIGKSSTHFCYSF